MPVMGFSRKPAVAISMEDSLIIKNLGKIKDYLEEEFQKAETIRKRYSKFRFLLSLRFASHEEVFYLIIIVVGKNLQFRASRDC
jgi:hypothetical protein